MKKRKKKTPFQLYLERKKKIKKERKDREALEKQRRKASGDSGDVGLSVGGGCSQP